MSLFRNSNPFSSPFGSSRPHQSRPSLQRYSYSEGSSLRVVNKILRESKLKNSNLITLKTRAKVPTNRDHLKNQFDKPR
jgi:hypothetical protein